MSGQGGIFEVLTILLTFVLSVGLEHTHPDLTGNYVSYQNHGVGVKLPIIIILIILVTCTCICSSSLDHSHQCLSVTHLIVSVACDDKIQGD